MADKEKMSYEAIQAALSEPFDESVIQKVTKGNKQFSNVAPHQYVKRLRQTLPLGYDVIEGTPVIAGNAVAVNVAVRLFIDANTVRTSAANGTADIPANPTEDEVGYAIKSAGSDGFKRALMKYGMGLHLYFEEAENVGQEKPAPRKLTPPKPAAQDDFDEEPAPRPQAQTQNKSWTGNLEVKFGKFKGQQFKEVEDSYIDWYLGTEKNDKNATSFDMFGKEKARRVKLGEWNPAPARKSNKPTTKRRIDQESDETDF